MDGADFDGHVVIESGTRPSGFDCFVEIFCGEQDVAADDFLGLGVGPIGHGEAASAAEDFAGQFESVGAFHHSFLLQALHPGVEARHDFPQFLRRRHAPVRLAKQKHVVGFCGLGSHDECVLL